MRKTTYTDAFKDFVLSKIARGNETIVEASVSRHVPYATLLGWCREAGIHERTERTLHVWVPTNRYDVDQRPTHMDGWNEILDAYKANRHRGGERELSNVAHVACYARAAYGHDVDAKAPGMHVCVRALYPRSCDLWKG